MTNELSVIKQELLNSPLLDVLGPNKDKYIVSVISEIAKTANDFSKDLTKCSRNSIITAIKAACDLNLEIDSRQHCHLIKFNKNVGTKENPKWISEAQLQIGYRGFIYSIKRAYPDANIDCRLIYEGDKFTMKKQGDLTTYSLEVSNPFGKSDKIIGGFCYISYTLGNRLVSFCETMSIDEINKIKGVAKTQDLWNKWFEEKAKVAIIKRACKIHLTGIQEISNIIEYDNQEYDLKKSKTANIAEDIDLNFDEIPVMKGTKKQLDELTILTEEEKKEIEEREGKEND